MHPETRALLEKLLHMLAEREKKKLTGTSAGKYSERKKADYGIVCCPAWGNGLE